MTCAQSPITIHHSPFTIVRSITTDNQPIDELGHLLPALQQLQLMNSSLESIRGVCVCVCVCVCVPCRPAMLLLNVHVLTG